MAAGVMHAIHEHGLQIPGNISVTGFDDIPLAHQLWPKLTTVRQPLEAMAREAARLLIARILRERPDDVNVVVDSQLVVRASTDVVSRAAD
jgi:LacI family transcriptional regulator